MDVPGFPGRLFLVHVTQVVILQSASGVELERKIPADVGGLNRVARRRRGRMEVHNARFKSAALKWQLPGVGRAEDRIDDSHRTISRDYACINSVEARGSPLELRPCGSVCLG